MKKFVSLLIAILVAVVTIPTISIFGYAESASAELQEMYASAELLMAKGDYNGAASKFEALGSYSDASQMAMYCKSIGLAELCGFASSALFDTAIESLQKLGEFRDSTYLTYYYTGHKYESIADSIELSHTEIETYNDQGLTLSYADMIEKLTDVDLQSIVSAFSDEELYEAGKNYGLAADTYYDIIMFKDCSSAWARCNEKKRIIEDELKKRIKSVLTSGIWVCFFKQELENQAYICFLNDNTWMFKHSTNVIIPNDFTDAALTYEIEISYDDFNKIYCYYGDESQSKLMYITGSISTKEEHSFKFDFYFEEYIDNANEFRLNSGGRFVLHIDNSINLDPEDTSWLCSGK